MKLLGLTGGIGMGKSTCAQLLRARNIPVVDTDDLARSVVDPGQPALAEISAVFGSQMLDNNGALNREAVAKLVFSDSAARQQLESILHPRIRKLWQEHASQWRLQDRTLGVVVIPLLFETGADSDLDATICVACSETSQLDRLRSRGWSAEQIEQRIRAQLPVEQKLTKSNYVIWTEGEIDLHAQQLDRILQSLECKIPSIPNPGT